MIFLLVMIILVGINSSKMTANAASYGASWQSWNMASSDYAVMRGYGCRVTAYAKMLSEIGLNGFGNPDDLYKWGVENGKFQGQITEKGVFGKMMMDYVNATGGSAIKVGQYRVSEAMEERDAACEGIMGLINQGYICFLHGATTHTVYIGREESLAQGTPIIMDSDGKKKPYKDYKGHSMPLVDYFSISGDLATVPTPGTSDNNSPITYNSITHGNITGTTAFVKANVNADCNQLSEVGMEWGYFINGAEVAQPEFAWKTGNVLNYISVDFGKEKNRSGNVVHLQPGRTVYYRFFATKKDGCRVFSPKQNFVTPCAHDYTKETNIRAASCSESGIIQYECGKCGACFKKNVPTLGHNYEPVVVEPTNYENGYTLHRCSRCGDSYKDNYTDKKVESKVNSIIFNTITASDIASTTAVVKTEVSADCSQLSEVGMEWVYLTDGVERPQTEFNWQTGTYLTFISVEFGKEVDRYVNVPILEPGQTVYYRFFAVGKNGNRIYSDTNSFVTESVQNEGIPSREEEPTANCITFDTNTVSNINSNTAFVKTTVTADCTKLSAVGMEWGYLVDGAELSQTEFNWRTGTYLTFISVDFGKEIDSYGNIPTLESGRTVYYWFFATRKDGSRIYSDTNYFETTSVQREEHPVRTEEPWADCITFDTITVSNVTSSTAFVKTTVTADCTKLSAVGMEWGYLVDGAEFPQTEFSWKTGTYLNFISIDFGREIDRYGNIPTLESDRTVYYQFFAEKKDGSRIYADKGYFTT